MPRGRPKKNIDPAQVSALAQIQCTYDEMASVLKCDRKTLMRNFGTVIKEGWEQGKMSVRREQFKAAMGGNITMLIWLGKQHLGQSDKAEVNSDNKLAIDFDTADDSTLVARAAQMLSGGCPAIAGTVLGVQAPPDGQPKPVPEQP
jgi:hypothetical protein